MLGPVSYNGGDFNVAPCATAAEETARAQTTNDAPRTALAIEQFGRATRELTQTLDALAPRFLKQVPFAPFDGERLRYVPAQTAQNSTASGETEPTMAEMVATNLTSSAS